MTGGAELERLLSGQHSDPHSVLGAHVHRDGIVVRTLRPGAAAVAATSCEQRVELTEIRPGLFEGVFGIHGTMHLWAERHTGIVVRIQGDLPLGPMTLAVDVVAAANNYLLPAWMIGFGVWLVITSRTERLTPAHV